MFLFVLFVFVIVFCIPCAYAHGLVLSPRWGYVFCGYVLCYWSKGRNTVKVVPRPMSDFSLMVPWWASTIFFT